MMKRTMVYPFGREFFPVLDNTNLIENDIEITTLISPKAWGYSNQAFYTDKNRNLPVHSTFSNHLDSIDLLWIVDSEEELNFEEFIIPKIEIAKKRGIEVLFTRRKYLNDTQKYVERFNDQTCKTDYDLTDSIERQLFEIDTPVIALNSLHNGLNKLELQLSLGRAMMEHGIRVLQLSEYGVGSKIGMDTLPNFIFENDLDFKRKVFYLNDYIHRKVLEIRPDIIILSIPGEVANVSPLCVGDFGFYNYLISKAVRIDIGIMNIPYFKVTSNDTEHLGKLVLSQFGYNIDYFNMEPKTLLFSDSEIYGFPCYLHLDSSFIKEHINFNTQKNVISSSENNQIKKIVNEIIDQLNAFGEITLI